MKFILKYFPEITIKSKPVRKYLVRLLQDNLRATLKPVCPGVQVTRYWDYLTVEVPQDAPESAAAAVAGVLGRTAGIAYFARVASFPLIDLDDVLDKTLALWGEQLRGKTFAVRCKRAGQHDFSSLDVERQVGAGLMRHSGASGVKLRDPDITIQLEIRDRQLLIVSDRFTGIGGFPIGGAEPVLSLISGGFDSTVASYLCMRRGMRTHYCFFNLGGRDHELGVKEVAHYLWHQYGGGQRVHFVTVPFEPVVAEILRKVQNSQMGVILKRMMLRAASRIAARLNTVALVTGESVAQVSSQTLTNLQVIDQVSDTLVLRPLITTHKSEIIRLAEEIGTAPFAAHMPEYCGVISVKPTTRARSDRIRAEEERFDFDVLEQAIAAAIVEPIDAMQLSHGPAIEVEVLSAPIPNSEVVDIRAPDQALRQPLRTGNVKIRQIPFYELQQRASELDPATTYLLYCEQGVMSRLHASHLTGQGYSNVKVYRPG